MKNTDIAAKLLEMAKELLEPAVEVQEAPEKEQKTTVGLQLGKVYRRIGPYDSTVMATDLREDGLRCYGFRKDSDGDVDEHGSTFGTVNEWHEVTNERELGQLAHEAFAVMDVKEGDYLTVFWEGFDSKEEAAARRSDPFVIKVTLVDLDGCWPVVDGNSVSVVSKVVSPEENSYLFPAVFRKSTEEEIELYEEHFSAGPPEIVSASGLKLKVGDRIYADCDKEYAKVTAINATTKAYSIRYFSYLDEVNAAWIPIGSNWDSSIRIATHLEEALIEAMFSVHESETVK